MIGKDSLRFWFCLCFLVSPGLTQVPKPADCLVSGVYDLIRLPESKDGQSCYHECFDEPNCHMAVVSKPLSGSPQCLLVNCLNQGRYYLTRDPSAEITVYPKNTIEDEQRAFLMKGAYGWANERFRCFGFMEDSSCKLKTPRFFFNRDSYRCEQVPSGCGSKRNTFDTQEACETFCNERRVCYLPVEYGENPPLRFSNVYPIRGKPDENVPHNRFFHNMSSFRCEGFTFRGSLSNGNLFDTVEECEKLCGDVKVRCFDFMEDRTCKPRFFYNTTSYKCEQVSSGCGSNRNTFATRESCEALCNEKYLCYRPVEYGQRPPFRFDTYLPESDEPENRVPNFFFYNLSSLRCEGFHFRGSASNGNIFSSEEECERLCGDVKAPANIVTASNIATATTLPALDSVTTTSKPAVGSDNTVTPSADPVPAQNTATTTKPRDVDSDSTVVVPKEGADIAITPSADPVPAQNTATTTKPHDVDSDSTVVVPKEGADVAVTPSADPVPAQNTATTTKPRAVDSDSTRVVPKEGAVTTTNQPAEGSDNTVTPSADPVPAQNTDVSAPVSRDTAAVLPIFVLSILLLGALVITVLYLRRSWCPSPIRYRRV